MDLAYIDIDGVNVVDHHLTGNKVTDADGGVPGLGQRAAHLLDSVDGPEAPGVAAGGLLAALDLETETGTVLEPDYEVELGGFGSRL